MGAAKCRLQYLKQLWFLISEILWPAPDSLPATTLYEEFSNYAIVITATPPQAN